MTVQDAVSPEDLAPDLLYKHIIQPGEAVAHLPGVEVTTGERTGVCNGRPLGKLGILGSFRVEAGGELLAIYRDVGECARAEVVLCDP
jgi:hypothetical protein